MRYESVYFSSLCLSDQNCYLTKLTMAGADFLFVPGWVSSLDMRAAILLHRENL